MHRPLFTVPRPPAGRPWRQRHHRRATHAARPLATLLLGACLALPLQASVPDAARVPVGFGAYLTQARPGGERLPPAAQYRSTALAGAVPTNQWYSSVLYQRWSHPLYAQPLSYQASAAGFQIGWPEKSVLPVSSRDENDIGYPHRAALTVAPLGFEPDAARLAKVSDWAVDIALGHGAGTLTATIAHGSPFSYYQVTGGGVRIGTAGPSSEHYRSPDGKVLAMVVEGKAYAIYAPAGARWEVSDTAGIGLHLPPGAGYFSIAALPDLQPGTVAAYGRYAYAFITDTRVDWQYDAATSAVTTTYSVQTRAMEGQEHGTLMGLYPHQWHANPLLPALLPYQYDTVRGALKMAAGSQFQVRRTYHGILPWWPGLAQPAQRQRLARLLEDDMRAGAEAVLRTGGTYWQGKGLGKAVQLMNVAEQQGQQAYAGALLDAVKARVESWLRGSPQDGPYLLYDAANGTLLGYPDEFGSAAEMNDHHFHYGYWIFAAAQIALRDPEWASPQHWGGMVNMLVADIATTARGDRRFPFLRNFDAYEGHAWASGTAPFFDGNNQESSSEAIHAWAALILWGEATGDKALRDTGIYLYTSEIAAAQYYWFDLHRLVFAPEYQSSAAGIVWGSKYTHTAWWTEDPREVHGINLLPLTTASLYLGYDPAYVQRNLQAMDRAYQRYRTSEREQHAPPQIWQDILLQYAALNDPAAALTQWDEQGMVEEGETPSHTYHFMQSLANLGRPDFSVTANTPFYGVFRTAGGQRHYLAFNASQSAVSVMFSDGMTLRVPPRRLAQGARKP